jgi:hypothetical protein
LLLKMGTGHLGGDLEELLTEHRAGIEEVSVKE